MTKRAKRMTWLAVVVLVLVGPSALYLWRSDGRLLGVVIVVLGLLGLVAMVLATMAPSRLRSLTAALGIDAVIGGHRWLGIGALALVLGHLAVAVIRRPALIDPLAASPAIQLGYGATVAMLGLGAAAAWGRRPGARYELWARAHIALAAGALLLAGLHVWWLGDLLSDPVMRVVCSVLALALLAVLVRRWVWQPLLSPRGAYMVYGVRPEGVEVATLVLAPVSLRSRLHFAPGQFVWLRLRRRAVGTEEHPFTIASSAEHPDRIELTVRASGDFSSALAGLTPGAKVWLDGPHGSFTPEEHSLPRDGLGALDGLVLVAGGVGITPMMSMLRTLAERGDRRRHRLVLAERADAPLFSAELDALAGRLDLDVVRLAGRRIDAVLLRALLPRVRGRLDYYVCGPASLVDGTLAALGTLGVPASRVHTEQFSWTGPVPVLPVPRATTSGPLPVRR